MGTLIYGGNSRHEFDDRVLSHLKIALVLKLREEASFFLSWQLAPEEGNGRASILISRDIPLEFRFSGGRQPETNPEWIEVLLELSRSPRGLVLLSETEAAAYRARKAGSNESE